MPLDNECAEHLAGYIHYSDIPNHYPQVITPNRILWLMRHRYKNGLADHTLTIGNKLYVHLPSFARWLTKKGSNSSDARQHTPDF